jgi:predicted nucleic acid-binding protein
VIVFVDTSIRYSAANRRDVLNERAKAILDSGARFVTSNFVLAETWRLLHHHMHWHAAEAFWRSVRRRPEMLEQVLPSDLEMAWLIGERFEDQEFSLTDCPSFALMERLRIQTVASFDNDLAIYRFGRGGSEAFEVLR